MLQAININGSTLYFEDTQGPYTAEYYFYCCKLLINSMGFWDNKLNVILGPYNPHISNHLPVIKIDIQPEHTLVREGGRSVEELIFGNVKTLSNDGNYLVRVPNFNYYNSLDYKIEYSIPNIKNLQLSNIEKFVNYSKTCLYVAPMIYDEFIFDSTKRQGSFCLFSGNTSKRRSDFLAKTKINNIQNIFSKSNLKDLYLKSKIMINIHQTDHHHTFEELRVLPALCNGVLVISEDVPLKEYIPYEKGIIWSSYENLHKTLQDVEENYEEYRSKIFNDDLKKLLNSLKERNHSVFNNIAWQNNI